MTDLTEQMRRHVASYKTLTNHRQACLDMCDEIERLTTRIAKLEAVLDGLQRFVDAQAEDEGLWCIASYASEAYIQNGLRSCHRYIEQAIAALKDTEVRHE